MKSSYGAPSSIKRLAAFWLLCSACFAQQLAADGKLHFRVSGSGNNYFVTLTQNIPAIVFDATFPGAIVSLTFTEDSTGGRTVAFDPTILSTCLITTSANAVTNCQYYYDAGVNQWFSSAIGGGTTVITQPGMNINPANYNWTRNPSGSLSTIGAQIVTLTPVPQGIDATDVWTYIQVSGGGGATEYALITGGNAVGGASTGTIQFTTVNAHAAGYTLGSASQGWQEASNAARFIPQNPTSTAQGGIVTGTAGQEYQWGARVTIHSSNQNVNFSGSVIDCNMNDSCLFIGDANPNLIIGVRVTGFQGRAGIANGTKPMIEDSAQFTQIDGVYNRNPLSGNTFGYLIQADNDQSAHYSHVNAVPNGASGSLRCDATFCGSAIFAPGPFSVNASVLWIDHSSLTMNCLGNAIDDQQGNTLHVTDTVIQNWSQFGIRSSLVSGGAGPSVLDNIYEEGSGCFNPTYTGSVAANAGIIQIGGNVYVRGGELFQGVLPQFSGGTGSGTRLNLFVAAIDSILGKSTFFPLGYTVNTAGTVNIQWPKITGTNTITYDIVEVPGNQLTVTNIPIGSLAGGAPGSFSGSLPGGTGIAQCAGPTCSLSFNVATNLGAYVVPASPAYLPLITFWPGALVMAAVADATSSSALNVLPVAFLDAPNFFQAPLVAESNAVVSVHARDCLQYNFPPQMNVLIECAVPLPKVFSLAPPCTSTLEGMALAFTDSTTATFGGTITGGGTNHVGGRCNGTNWTVY